MVPAPVKRRAPLASVRDVVSVMVKVVVPPTISELMLAVVVDAAAVLSRTLSPDVMLVANSPELKGRRPVVAS